MGIKPDVMWFDWFYKIILSASSIIPLLLLSACQYSGGSRLFLPNHLTRTTHNTLSPSFDYATSEIPKSNLSCNPAACWRYSMLEKPHTKSENTQEVADGPKQEGVAPIVCVCVRAKKTGKAMMLLFVVDLLTL